VDKCTENMHPSLIIHYFNVMHLWIKFHENSEKYTAFVARQHIFAIFVIMKAILLHIEQPRPLLCNGGTSV
jgi:hypothetical protein